MNTHRLAILALLGSSAVASAQTADLPTVQRVIPAGSVAAMAGPAANFTGTASVRPLASPIAPGRASCGEVTFHPGARSNWHTHPAGQMLYVTAGCGWTQQEGQPAIRICKGDTVSTPPGVKHWHGAGATTGMSHLAVTEMVDGRAVDWLEPVTDQQFEGATRAAR